MSPRSASIDQLEQLASLFWLLADRTRLNILMLLTDGERNVSSLCDELALPQPTVSHHLGLLRSNNIIAPRRQGKQVFYALNGRVNVVENSAIQVGGDRFDVRIIAKN